MYFDFYKYNAICVERAAARRRVLINEIAPVVLDIVHIGNLGALPPSPRVLVDKAIQLGLLTPSEHSELVWM